MVEPTEHREHVDVLPVAPMALLALLIGFMPLPWDPDLWFHLADGNYILSHHAVPQADPFSFTKQGELWVPHSWLFDVAASLVWSGLGAQTAEACMAVVAGAIALVLLGVLWWYPQRIDARYASLRTDPGHKGAFPARQAREGLHDAQHGPADVLFADPDLLKVFIDSRPGVYGDEIFRQARCRRWLGRGGRIVSRSGRWRQLVLQRQDKLAEVLSHRADWTLLAEDPAALTFIRSNLVASH